MDKKSVMAWMVIFFYKFGNTVAQPNFFNKCFVQLHSMEN